jgi:Fe-S cluster assembly protein SufD
MTQAPAKNQSYRSDFRTAEQATDGPAWLRDIRAKAMARFEELGFPTARKGNEKWKYTNVAPIARSEFGFDPKRDLNGLNADSLTAAVPWHDTWHRLVFVDGVFAKDLSSRPEAVNSVRVSSLAAALVSDNGAVQEHLAKHALFEDDGFAALNTAFVRDGAYVRVPSNVTLEAPLHLVFVSTGRAEPTVSYPRVLLVAEAGSRATVIESYAALGDGKYFNDAVSETILGEGAEIEHYRLQAEGESAFHVGTARVVQAEGSNYSSSAFFKGSSLGRYDLSVLLDGPGSTCRLNGLYMTSGSQHQDNNINIEHAKPHTTSRLYYKGILDGKSRAVFGGTVLVRKEAQKTDALQSDKNLVLSPDAEIDSKPALFIYADDVKCGHGATAGNIDLDTVFYMRSRGLDVDAASRLLIYGFARESIDTVREQHLKTYLESLFLESLPKYRFEF